VTAPTFIMVAEFYRAQLSQSVTGPSTLARPGAIDSYTIPDPHCGNVGATAVSAMPGVRGKDAAGPGAGASNLAVGGSDVAPFLPHHNDDEQPWHQRRRGRQKISHAPLRRTYEVGLALLPGPVSLTLARRPGSPIPKKRQPACQSKYSTSRTWRAWARTARTRTQTRRWTSCCCTGGKDRPFRS
jgi:hypothetical protein